MICTTINAGVVQQVAFNLDGTCPNLVALSYTEFVNISNSQITASDILYDFSWGFGAVLTFWSIGYAVGVAKAVIQKL